MPGSYIRIISKEIDFIVRHKTWSSMAEEIRWSAIVEYPDDRMMVFSECSALHKTEDYRGWLNRSLQVFLPRHVAMSKLAQNRNGVLPRQRSGLKSSCRSNRGTANGQQFEFRLFERGSDCAFKVGHLIHPILNAAFSGYSQASNWKPKLPRKDNYSPILFR